MITIVLRCFNLSYDFYHVVFSFLDKPKDQFLFFENPIKKTDIKNTCLSLYAINIQNKLLFVPTSMALFKSLIQQ
ncbi:hypothetical protein HYN56_16605 [Flavobacterium crocinum]|uniref:Uncharacterized protein n=1 Tax=Flavobacterium crocinum TaxID=2183896 RepID=A0A2S1YNZ5_9FLAO|nr:hypothetical protein HYN56_16605 [Flavobacterium crocinum]